MDPQAQRNICFGPVKHRDVHLRAAGGEQRWGGLVVFGALSEKKHRRHGGLSAKLGSPSDPVVKGTHLGVQTRI